MTRKAALAAVFIFASGCRNPFSPGNPSLRDLLDAAEEITIDGRRLTLETYLWRDFMPGVGSGGGPLLALVRVTAVDRLPFPSAVDADRLWIVRQDAVWEKELSETINESPHQLSKMARDGPRWGPSVYVDVIVRVVHITGKRYLLRASHQLIGAAY
ncbi:MAG: hypothetical protein JXE07_09335 [Candidatus Aminicenantes bacterium]|nr:hypothetical protein [Candidatus Aminicenantes bacterium]